MNTPHKHAEVIKAWADGAKIEFRDPNSPRHIWHDVPHPAWVDGSEYRVKIEPKKYKVDVWLVLFSNGKVRSLHFCPPPESDYGWCNCFVVHHTLEGELPNE